MTICEGLPSPTREEILTKSKGMDGILWATHCELNAEALDAAGNDIYLTKIYRRQKMIKLH